jgi:hypothetical protein
MLPSYSDPLAVTKEDNLPNCRISVDIVVKNGDDSMDPRIQALLSDSVLKDACSRYGIDRDELTFIGGYQNFIYAYERDSAAYILLRLTPNTLRTPELVGAELEWSDPWRHQRRQFHGR